MDPQEAFQILQPASVAVARDHSIESIQALSRAVEQILAAEKGVQNDDGSSCISEMKEYLVFPLFIILKSGKKLSWTMQEEIVRCMLLVLHRSSIDDFNFFQNIFTELFILLTNKKNPQKGNDLSEECKQSVLTCITTLIHNSSATVLEKMISNDFRPQLGHAVFMCLKLAQEEKNRSLRIEAIDCLSALGLKKFFTNISKAKQDNLSSSFTNFLPGIVTGLAKIANGDEKQGHKITCIAIDTWTYFVVLVMRDDFLKGRVSNLEESETVTDLRNKLFKERSSKKKAQESSQKSNKFHIPGPDEGNSPKLPNVDVSRKWVNETASKLIILIQSMTKLVSHSHWKVRLSLIHFAERLICKCLRSLTGAVVLALQVIITLRSDDIVDVGTAAQNSLLSVMNVIGFENQDTSMHKSMCELLEEHVYALCTQLPTIFRQEDDTKTLSSVRQLSGCLEVLGDKISPLMTWPTHSLRLLRSLCFGLSLDVEDIDLLLERTSAEDPFGILTIKPSLGRSFKHFQDVRIFEAIASSCKLIGYHSNITVVSDLCMELLQDSQSRIEAFILFTLILQGREKNKCKDKDGGSISSVEHESVVQNILEVLINLEIFDIPLSVVISNASNKTEEEDKLLADALVPVNRQENISVDMVKRNVVLVVNALNLVGATALMMGKDFEMFLSTILCSVMEKTGESNVLVSFTGRNTLAAIAQACEYEEVAKLIENSVHHYWYPLSLKLKRLLQHPSAPLVLQVCLEYASINVVAFTEELVQDVLISLDSYHNDQALPLLRILLVYIMAVIRYETKSSEVHHDLNVKCKSGEEEPVNVGDRNPKSEELLFFLRDYHTKQLQIKESLENEENEEPMEEEDIKSGFSKDKDKSEDDVMDEVSRPEENKIEAPLYIKHVVEILEKCSHLLYVQDRKLKLLILEVIRVGSDALLNWENERLPVFHKLWKPLVLRMKDSDFIVMMHSFDVLTIMAMSSGDFLKRRIVKEVFPVILLFLKSQGSVSLGKTKKSGYYMTAGYRAQSAILKHLPSLVKSLKFGVLETDELLNVMVSYLDVRQPQQLLSYALNVIKEVKEIHPQHVWLALAYQQPPVRIVPPSSCLEPVHIKSIPRVQLSHDVVELFEQLS